ncbi:MAG TPA: hypothetical protein VER79_01290 [Candidatus Limnocylindrales bacterium]|nr:hypothetical protein [Candidatus Limnocylindrales bacterium]
MRTIDESGPDPTLPMVELNALRMEAMALYERCLGDNSPAPFERFLERHLVELPPPLALLNEVSDDLFQRMQSIRQSQFDLRDRLLTASLRDFKVDLGALLPLRDLDELECIQPHALTSGITPALSSAEQTTLTHVLEQARQSAVRLGTQRDLTQILYDTVNDWALALTVVSVHDHWQSSHQHIVQNVWSSTL